MKTPKTVFVIADPHSYAWDTLKLAYFSPDDPRIVRTMYMVDSAKK
jgi:hypothetical protein